MRGPRLISGTMARDCPSIGVRPGRARQVGAEGEDREFKATLAVTRNGWTRLPAAASLDEVGARLHATEEHVHADTQRERKSGKCLHGQVLTGLLDAEQGAHIDAGAAGALRLSNAQSSPDGPNPLTDVGMKRTARCVRGTAALPIRPVLAPVRHARIVGWKARRKKGLEVRRDRQSHFPAHLPTADRPSRGTGLFQISGKILVSGR